MKYAVSDIPREGA